MTPHLDAVGLIASDLGRTMAFYRALGALSEKELHEGNTDSVDVSGHLDIDLGRVRLMVDTEAVMTSFDPEWTRLSSRVTLAARCSHPDVVDEFHTILSQLGNGSHLKPFNAPWGQRYASVLDPDGVRIDLYASID